MSKRQVQQRASPSGFQSNKESKYMYHLIYSPKSSPSMFSPTTRQNTIFTVQSLSNLCPKKVSNTIFTVYRVFVQQILTLQIIVHPVCVQQIVKYHLLSPLSNNSLLNKVSNSILCAVHARTTSIIKAFLGPIKTISNNEHMQNSPYNHRQIIHNTPISAL
jgi:hypothetical protein